MASWRGRSLFAGALILAGLAAVGGAACGNHNVTQNFSAAASTGGGPDQFLLVGSPGRLTVVNVATESVVGCIPLSIESPWDVKVTPDGSKAYVTDFTEEDGSSISSQNVVVDLALARQVNAITISGGPFGLAITPDGSRLYVTLNGDENGDDDTSVAVVDTSSDTVIATITGVGTGGFPSISPDGSRLFVPNTENNNLGNDATIIDTGTNRIVGRISGTGAGSQVGSAAAGDDSAFWATSEDDAGFAAFSATSPFAKIHETRNVSNTEEGGAIDVGPDGTIFVAENNQDFVVDPATGRTTKTLTANSLGGDSTPFVRVNPGDSTVYLTGGTSSELAIFDASSTGAARTFVPVVNATGIAGVPGNVGPVSSCRGLAATPAPSGSGSSK